MGQVEHKFLDVITVKGRKYYYYRRNGRRIKLPPDPLTNEFVEAYNKIHASFEEKREPQLKGGIALLIEGYKESANYKQLKPRVKQLYTSVLDPFREKYGQFSIKGITKRFVLDWRDSMIETPAKANNALTALKAVFAFADGRGFTEYNPTSGIKKLKVGEWRPWVDPEIHAFYKVASKEMALALDLALYTGQRQGDVRNMHWNQISDGGISVTQEKTNKRLWIPIHSSLRERLENTKRVSVMILASPAGVPYQKRYLSEKFKETSRLAGLPEDCVFHGLRKTACVKLAEAGCTEKQISSITGQSEKMIAHYTKMANQKLLAKEAMKKFEKKKV